MCHRRVRGGIAAPRALCVSGNQGRPGVSARERILARIRARQGKPAQPDAVDVEAVRAHLAARARNPGPRDDERDVLTRFRERAVSLASTVDEATVAEVPARVAEYLQRHALPSRLVCWSEFAALDWSGAGIHAQARLACADDMVGLTGAFCGIAETGTLMTLSGARTPPSVSLLPETHICLLQRSRIVRCMEDAWTLLRNETAALPRAVSFISGPSRTADIEQTVTLGAHGPYRVHIILTT